MTTSTQVNTLLEAALSYAARGWRVFPVKARDKAPLTANGFKDATKDEGTIRRWFETWPNANIGIATGAVSGIIVLDVDAHGDVNGEESLASLEKELGTLPKTVEAITGGGGRHILFLYPGGAVRNRTALRPGLDVKADGGYIVAPQSLHPSGRPYAWDVEHHLDEVQIAEAPAWLLDLIRKSARGKAPAALPGTIPHGQRNNTLTSLAISMRKSGMSEDAILAALLEENRTRCDPPLDEEEVRQIAASIGKYEPSANSDEIGLVKRLADAILEHNHFARDAGGKLYVYSGGVYRPHGERAVQRSVKGLLEEWSLSAKWTSHRTKEVAEYIRVDAPELWERPPLTAST